jgi:glycine dehydrogenase subunit 1
MAHFTGDTIADALPAITPDPELSGLIARIDEETACVVVQYPDILGRISDLTPVAEAAHAKGALLVVVNTEPVALGACLSPGEMGADIVVGEGQSLGVGLQFGGPYLGLFAVRDPKHVRQMPGRLCGETTDAEGKRAFVLTLSTREQHIRREKATSNICTNSGLCALAFTVHMTLLGERGLRELAAENHRLACIAADRLAKVPGVEVLNNAFFNEFTVMLGGKPAREIIRDLANRGVLGGVSLGRLYPGVEALEHALLVAVTETTTEEDIERLAQELEASIKESVA